METKSKTRLLCGFDSYKSLCARAYSELSYYLCLGVVIQFNLFKFPFFVFNLDAIFVQRSYFKIHPGVSAIARIIRVCTEDFLKFYFFLLLFKHSSFQISNCELWCTY